MESPACDVVMNAKHPSYANGGPCHECAFRAGTEAYRSVHTQQLARLCVEGFREFQCHIHPHVCRGFNAAIRVRGAPKTQADKRHAEAAGIAADILGECIGLIT